MFTPCQKSPLWIGRIAEVQQSVPSSCRMLVLTRLKSGDSGLRTYRIMSMRTVSIRKTGESGCAQVLSHLLDLEGHQLKGVASSVGIDSEIAYRLICMHTRKHIVVRVLPPWREEPDLSSGFGRHSAAPRTPIQNLPKHLSLWS